MKTIISAISIFLFITVFAYAEDTIPSRYGHTMTIVDGEIYIFGGVGGSVSKEGPVYNDLSKFDVESGSFEQINPIGDLPPARHGHAAFEYMGNLMVFYGENDNGALDDIWIYDPESNTWTEQDNTGANIPESRSYPVCSKDGSTIYLTSGLSNAGDGLMDSWSYDLSTNEWSSMEDYPGACAGGAGFTYDGNPHVFAGFDPDAKFISFRNDIWVFLIASLYWDFVNQSGLTISERSFFSFVLTYAAIVYIFGGMDYDKDIALNDSYVLDLSTFTWSQLSDGPHLSKSAAVFLDDENILIFGGLNENGDASNNMWRYNPANDNWNNIVGIQPMDSSKETFTVFPNPTNEYFTIDLSSTLDADYIELYDLSGKLVHRINIPIRASSNFVFGSELERGSYILKIDHMKPQKIVKF